MHELLQWKLCMNLFLIIHKIKFHWFNNEMTTGAFTSKFCVKLPDRRFSTHSASHISRMPIFKKSANRWPIGLVVNGFFEKSGLGKTHTLSFRSPIRSGSKRPDENRSDRQTLQNLTDNTRSRESCRCQRRTQSEVGLCAIGTAENLAKSVPFGLAKMPITHWVSLDTQKYRKNEKSGGLPKSRRTSTIRIPILDRDFFGKKFFTKNKKSHFVGPDFGPEKFW